MNIYRRSIYEEDVETDERFRRKSTRSAHKGVILRPRDVQTKGSAKRLSLAVNPENQWHENLNIVRRNRIGSHRIASCYDVAGGTMEIKMTIIYEKADGLIQASVAELPGAISLGADVEEARRNLDEAIEMVLEGNRLLAEDVTREKISSEEIAFRAA